jgi:hypothetical protein
MKIVQPRQIETATREDIMAVKVPKELLAMAEEDWHFLLDLKQVKALKIKSLDLKTLRTHKKLRQYIYYTGKLDDLLGHRGATAGEDSKLWDMLAKHSATDSLATLQDPSFDTKNLIYFWSDAHLWYQFRGETPLSPTYYVGYIGGVANNHYDLDKAEKILKKNRHVSRVTKVDIPHYNREFGHDKAVEFYVRLSQKDHDKIVKYYRDEKKAEFWTCRVKDCLASSYSLDPFDILGLKAALKPESAKKEGVDEDDED